jgi:hypothetical protein
LKEKLAGQRLESNSEVIAFTEEYFSDLDKSFYRDGLKALEKCLTKCVEIEDDYVEK